ncbi:hypothetical protein FRX31_030309 [Thalictrum thalictroides]|uniref:Uncharacterized protein n=1 Tax=Thalictrum thalictroides TaxID=46969 RepID=A0A7J6V7E2_THATH|nr:hypothetical protein FRX31_030309 [Thalictrum thalictroides]
MKAAELKTRVEKEERGLGPGGLEGTGEDGWIIELGADRRGTPSSKLGGRAPMETQEMQEPPAGSTNE